jgi:hypothetical protein
MESIGFPETSVTTNKRCMNNTEERRSYLYRDGSLEICDTINVFYTLDVPPRPPHKMNFNKDACRSSATYAECTPVESVESAVQLSCHDSCNVHLIKLAKRQTLSRPDGDILKLATLVFWTLSIFNFVAAQRLEKWVCLRLLLKMEQWVPAGVPIRNNYCSA